LNTLHWHDNNKKKTRHVIGGYDGDRISPRSFPAWKLLTAARRSTTGAPITEGAADKTLEELAQIKTQREMNRQQDDD